MSALNAGYENNINVVTVRASGNSSQSLSDRPIDFNGDGIEESVTVTTTILSGNKTKTTYTINAGAARSILEQTVEPAPIERSKNFFTEGI